VTQALKIKTKIDAIKKEANSVFFERDAEIDLFWVGMLARQHILFLGEPGIAKTNIAEALFGLIDDSDSETYQLHPQFKLEEIFGQPKFSELKKDRYVFKWEGRGPDKHFVTLDELFNGNPGGLQSFQRWLNERLFSDGEKTRMSKLQMAVCPTNRLPDADADALGALFDRLLLRIRTLRIGEQKNFHKMIVGTGKMSGENRISLGEIEEVQEFIKTIEVPETIVENIYKIRQAAKTSGLYVTDRRIKHGVSACKAAAFLNGHEVVEEEDLEIYENIIWGEEDQIDLARDVVLEIANPIGKQIYEAIAEAYEVRDQALDSENPDKRRQKAIEAGHVMQTVAKKVDDLIKLMSQANKMTGKYENLVAKLRMDQSQILLEGVGIDLNSTD